MLTLESAVASMSAARCLLLPSGAGEEMQALHGVSECSRSHYARGGWWTENAKTGPSGPSS